MGNLSRRLREIDMSKDIQVDRAGRPMFDAAGRKLSISEREEAVSRPTNKCRICGFEWDAEKGHGSHDCQEVKDARLSALETEVRHQKHMANKEYTRNLDTQDKYQQLRTLSQAVVDENEIGGETAAMVHRAAPSLFKALDALAKALGD
jgi:hypothetical protein